MEFKIINICSVLTVVLYLKKKHRNATKVITNTLNRNETTQSAQWRSKTRPQVKNKQDKDNDGLENRQMNPTKAQVHVQKIDWFTVINVDPTFMQLYKTVV